MRLHWNPFPSLVIRVLFFWKYLFDSICMLSYFQTLVNPWFALPVLMLSHWPPYHCVVTFIKSHNSSGRPKAAPESAGKQCTSSPKTMLYLSVLYFFHSQYPLSHRVCLLQCPQCNYKHLCVSCEFCPLCKFSFLYLKMFQNFSKNIKNCLVFLW